MLTYANEENRNFCFLFQKNSDSKVKDHSNFKGILFCFLTIKNQELGIYSGEIKN